jgi:coenzyme PQQ precursor peptide PqqA
VLTFPPFLPGVGLTQRVCRLQNALWSAEASGGAHMQEWHKPEVAEQDVGLEVTSYLSAEMD